MNNKFLLAIIAVQTAVMLGLLYILWDQKKNELIFNENTLLVLAVFSVMGLVLEGVGTIKVQFRRIVKGAIGVED